MKPVLRWAGCWLLVLWGTLLFARPDSLIYGLGIQLRVGLGGKGTSEFVVSLSAGVGKSIGRHTLLSYQMTANAYRGGLGNSLLPSLQNDYQLDLVNSFALTGGWGRSDRQRPLHHWSPASAATLSAPFLNGGTLASNFVWNNHHRSQQIGFVGLTVGNAQVGYYNDGPPFHLTGQGDGYDRWWTGGGYVQAFLPGEYQALAFFDKFTGFQRDAYELANAMRLNYVMYRDFEKMTYNRGRIGAMLTLPSGVAVSAAYHNTFDVQDFIHRLFRYPFHPSMYSKRMIIGTQYHRFGSPVLR
jgi:hypothetical protein